MAVSFEGFHGKALTFRTANDTVPGTPVKVSESKTVEACANNNVFCGKCIAVQGDYASVQLSGYVKMPYSGTAPSVGYAALAADGNGKVKSVTTGGRSYLVLDVDTAAGTVGFIL